MGGTVERTPPHPLLALCDCSASEEVLISKRRRRSQVQQNIAWRRKKSQIVNTYLNA